MSVDLTQTTDVVDSTDVLLRAESRIAVGITIYHPNENGRRRNERHH